MSGLVLVTGATGRQGGAVARHLLAQGVPVRALTRRPERPAAEALARMGAHLVRGDLDDPASLPAALRGVNAVFSVQDYWQAGAEGEVRQGTHLAQAAAEAGVQRFVQSTMATPAHEGGPVVGHFASKRGVERAVREAGLPHVFLGTVYFMDNVLDPAMGGSLTFPTLAGTLHPTTPLELVAVDDLGAVGAELLTAPDVPLGRRVDVVGDRLTVPAMKAAYRQATGRAAKRWRVPAWVMRYLNADFAAQLAWHNAVGFAPDPSLSQRYLPRPQSFEAFLRAHKPRL